MARRARLWRAARLPPVRMVALTGALVVRNASDNDDDLDYVLVTRRGAWIARCVRHRAGAAGEAARRDRA
ncbi:MAG: hypothetical protein U0521_17370 [Anaerolineae bacterium]